jgi:hypothetical protein
MSIDAVLARIDEIQQTLAPTGARGSAAGANFATQLNQATANVPGGTPATGSAASVYQPAIPAGGGVGAQMVARAQAEVGQAEQPPGSNDSPRIADYRSATAGAGVGPWCAYFVSWLGQQSGAPLGEQGQGFGAVSAVWGWAQRTGKAIPAGNGAQPQTGDLILWGGQHIGIVESVSPDGKINTIEGNSSNQVIRRSYGPDGGGATGYVRVG